MVGHLRVVKLVSLVHIAWGLSAILFIPLGIEFPRPFGSQEALLVYMPPWVMGVLMVTCAIICQGGIRKRMMRPWTAVLAVLPQQFILFWSLVWGLQQFVGDLRFQQFSVLGLDLPGMTARDVDARGWLALGYLGPLSFFHALDVSDLYEAAIRRGKTRDGA